MSNRHRKQNDFREWVSDNLRYILLIIGILAALVLLFFGVRAISSSLKGSSTASAGSSEVKSGVISGAAEAAESAATAEKEEAKSGAAKTSESGETVLIVESGASGAAQSQTAEAAASGASAADAAKTGSILEESRIPDIVELIKEYYGALSVQDLSAIQKITDTLPEEEAASISSSKAAYSDVKVYTKDGPSDNTQVVYAYYKYSNGAGSTSYPGLSQMLVRRGVDGNWKIVFSDLDQATADFIGNVTKEADVQALIAEVTKEYEEASGSPSVTKSPDSKAAVSENAAAVSSAGNADLAGTAPANEEVDEQEEASQDDEEQTDEDEEEEGSEDDSEEEESSSQEEEEDTSDQEWSAVINSSCNLRSGPGYDYGVIGGVAEGTEVTVIGDIEDGWWHIRTDETDGYVGGKFID